MAPKRRCKGPCGKLRIASAFPTDRARICKRCQRDSRREYSRERHLQETYGITTEEYDALLKAQGNVCAGCGGTRRYHLHVDHDHALEREMLARGEPATWAARCSIRGLLCAQCNKLLRDSRDNPSRLRSLARYLLNPPARKVLA